jgi:hypothetical protein
VLLLLLLLCNLASEHQEGTQVLHYVNGQKYDVHYDTFHDTVNSRK